MRLVLGTANEGKIAEFRAALQPLGLELLSAGRLGVPPPPEETGATFAENALLKARHYFGATGIASLADDSGLMVDALEGRPGVHSARYAPTDRERISRLLEELHRIPESGRSARFVCALCLLAPGSRIEVEGEVEGTILEAPRGEGGFGYDPIFYYPPLGKTFAELSRKEKNRVSHRARALDRLRNQVTRPSRP